MTTTAIAVTDEMVEAAQTEFTKFGYTASNEKALRHALSAALQVAEKAEAPPPQTHLAGRGDTSILRERISRAIFDPGQTGYKDDRTLTDWQTDAVMRVLGFPALATTEGSAK
jgi:hypothetical protein